MIPSNRWFPGTLAARAAWFQNFTTKFAVVAAGLGLTPADVTAVQNDNVVMQSLVGITEQLKTFEESVRQYRLITTEGAIGEPAPQFPATPALVAPASVPTGVFERLSDMRDRIMTAPAYTDAIGALLGILASTPEPPAEIKPVIKATPLFSGYRFTVNVTRMGMSGFKILVRRMESEAWREAAFGTNSPLEVEIAPTTPGQPERLQVCAQLLQKNQPIGQPSDPVYVTINP